METSNKKIFLSEIFTKSSPNPTVIFSVKSYYVYNEDYSSTMLTMTTIHIMITMIYWDMMDTKFWVLNPQP